MYPEDKYSWEYCTSILKILIASTVALLKTKKYLRHISDFLFLESPYSLIFTVIVHLLELQLEDLMAKTVQEEPATLNVDVYSGQSSKS